MVHTKVFVGNLSFSTAESELAKEFEVAGKVISANIITRGPRSLGYGFVEMESNEAAENSVRLLNKKEIDGRPINVEVAKPREEGEGGRRVSDRGSDRGGDRGGRGGFRGARGGRGGFRGGRGGSSEGEGGFRRRFRRRNGSDDEEQKESGGRGGFRGRGRPRRGPREEREDTRTPSKTTLFVANLPFSLDDDGFAKVFKDNGLAFKSAHVVKKRTGRSKGFGFAEFENEKDQQKALSEINNKSVDGRDLVVKVALIDENGNTEEDTKEEKKEEKTEQKN